MFKHPREFAALAACVFATVLASACFAENAAQETVLWRIGMKDNSSAEFTGKSFPDTYKIPPHPEK